MQSISIAKTLRKGLCAEPALILRLAVLFISASPDFFVSTLIVSELNQIGCEIKQPARIVAWHDILLTRLPSSEKGL